MAGSHVKTTAFSNTNPIDHTPTNKGDGLVCYIYNSIGAGNGSVTSLSGSLSGAWQKLLATVSDTMGGYHTLFTIPNCPAGADHLTAVFNGGSNPGNISIWVIEVTNVARCAHVIATGAFFNQQYPGTGDVIVSYAAGVTLPPGVAGAYLLGMTLDLNSNAMGAGGGFTQRYDSQAGSGGPVCQVADKRVTSSGDQTSVANSAYGTTHRFFSSLIAFAEPPSGIITVVQDCKVSGLSGATMTGAFNSDVTPGNAIQVVIRNLAATSFSNMRDGLNGANYAARGNVLSDAGGHHYQQWTLDNSAGGAVSVSVDCSPNASSGFLHLREIGYTSGYDTHAEQYQTGLSSPGTDIGSSGNATPSAQPGLISAVAIEVSGTATLLPGTGMTTDTAFSTGELTMHQRYTDTNARAALVSASGGSSVAMHTFAAFFKETSGGGPSVDPGVLMRRASGILGPRRPFGQLLREIVQLNEALTWLQQMHIRSR